VDYFRNYDFLKTHDFSSMTADRITALYHSRRQSDLVQKVVKEFKKIKLHGLKMKTLQSYVTKNELIDKEMKKKIVGMLRLSFTIAHPDMLHYLSKTRQLPKNTFFKPFSQDMTDFEYRIFEDGTIRYLDVIVDKMKQVLRDTFNGEWPSNKKLYENTMEGCTVC
jgi:hypothetical protein